jgi:biotin operon repressor
MTTDAKIFPHCAPMSRRRFRRAIGGATAISRAAIWSRIEELRQAGYEIEAGPHFGYRLIGSPDALHADDLLARLGKTKVIGRDIRCLKKRLRRMT